MTEPFNAGVEPELYHLYGLGLDATESEKRRALRDPAALIVEWETGGMTFILSQRARVIVRAGAMGGDEFEVTAGWHYLREVDMWKEWNEIRQVAAIYRRKGEPQ